MTGTVAAILLWAILGTDIGQAGDADPLGDIVLESDENVHVPTGSGMLLIAVQPRKVLVAASEPH
jgi:hypothetical protein